jgi:anti-sigma regulatory factor (Ser/Thr protein kinase)
MPNPFALVFDPVGLIYSLLERVGARNESPKPGPHLFGHRRTAVPVLRLPRHVDAGSLARDEVRARLSGRVSDAARTDVLHVVSELVANAVEHGRGAIELRIEVNDRHVLGEVADQGPGFEPVVHRQPFEFPLRGGLLIVGRLAERWGVTKDTARVWFAVACADSGPSTASAARAVSGASA